MTIANTFAAKASVAFVAVAMALMMVAPAKAQTAEELQAQIDTLMATIASLQAQAGGSATVSADAYVFTRALTIGSQGADVTALQNYLIGAGFSIPAGATGYFGAQTQAAVAAWQTANGVMPAAGYFGPVSQAKYNALMAATPSTGDDDTASDDDSSSDDDSDVSLSGEADLNRVEVKDGDDTDIEEGQEAAPVADVEVEFADGDAMITRMDVALVATDDGNDEVDPWDVFDEVSLWVDGDEVASMDASDEDNYLDEDDGSLRFSGLDLTAMEDEEVVVTVAVTVQGSVDGTSDGADWDVYAESIRFVDADDVTTTDDETGDLESDNSGPSADFTIDEQGGDDELNVKSSSEDPDATTIQVDESDKSDFTTIFAFDLDSDDSTNDIDVNELTVAVVTPNDVVNQVVSDIQLLIDGEVYDDVTWTNAGTATATAAFDIDGDLTIDAGDRVTVEVQVEFKALTGNYDEGDTIFASTTSDTIDAEGADDLGASQLDGNATGETHTLRSAGLVVETTDTNESLKENDDTDTADDEGVFTLKFDVTAFEEDVYVDNNATRGLVESNTGVNYILTSGGSTVTTGTTTASLSSTADLSSNGRYLVAEGETETFTLTVEFDPAISGFHALQLYSVNFNDSDADADTQQLTTPASDFDTEEISI